jgi:hypothetical protein
MLFDLLSSIIMSQCCSLATVAYGCRVYYVWHRILRPPNHLGSSKHAYFVIY